MNRRDAIKSGGAALVASVIAGRGVAASESGREHAAAGGVFTVTIRGASMLRFPKGGSSATLHFLGVHGMHDPIPTHLPVLTIGNELESPGQSGVRRWLLAGHEIEPVMSSPFKADGYNDVPNYNEKKIWKPANADWRSLMWIPKMNVAVDPSTLEDGTSARVKMNSGTLACAEPNDPSARKSLWIWTTPSGWLQFEHSLETAPQTAMTDQLVLSGTYAGEYAVIKLTPAVPSAAYELRIKPNKAGAAVNVALTAEPRHGVQRTRPLSLYSGYYNLQVDPPDPSVREAPYLSPIDFDGKNVHQTAGPGGQPTPRPLCGSFKVIDS